MLEEEWLSSFWWVNEDGFLPTLHWAQQLFVVVTCVDDSINSRQNTFLLSQYYFLSDLGGGAESPCALRPLSRFTLLSLWNEMKLNFNSAMHPLPSYTQMQTHRRPLIHIAIYIHSTWGSASESSMGRKLSCIYLCYVIIYFKLVIWSLDPYFINTFSEAVYYEFLGLKDLTRAFKLPLVHYW